MKRMLAFLLGAMLIFSGAAWAEAPAQTTEAIVEEQTEQPDFLEWLGQGWTIISGAVSSGWNTVTDSVGSGVETVSQTLSEWIETVETFISENSERVTEAVLDAWETVKQGVTHFGTIAWEKLQEAYETVLQWISGTQSEAAEEASTALQELQNIE